MWYHKIPLLNTSLLFFCLFALLLPVAIYGLSLLFSPKRPNPEKVSAYECGFDPYADARQRFEIRFYNVAIIFIVFDLETVYLFPWAASLSLSSSISLLPMLEFFFELLVGFIYIWGLAILTK